MGEVLTFSKQEEKTDTRELLWVCNCGCMSFELHADTTMKCSGCGVWSDAGEWRQRKPEPKEDVPELDPTNYNTYAKPAALVHAELAKEIKKGEHLASCLIRHDGSMQMWGAEHATTKARQAWFRKRVNTFKDFLLRVPVDE